MSSFLPRRSFVKHTLQAGAVAASPALLTVTGQEKKPPTSQVNDINIVGPKDGYTPEIGTLVSMMNWMRSVVVRDIQDLSMKELDYLHDDEANTIGGMIWHLAATERFYQINTFDGRHWEGLSSSDESKWDAASNLGNRGRRQIKGYDIDFYLELLENVRNFSLEELKKRDDDVSGFM